MGEPWCITSRSVGEIELEKLYAAIRTGAVFVVSFKEGGPPGYDHERCTVFEFRLPWSGWE
jgi:hypothetical protein